MVTSAIPLDNKTLNTIMNLNVEKKQILINLIVSSMQQEAKEPADQKEALLEKACGAWSHNGHTAEEDISMIYNARKQNSTRQIPAI